MNIESQQIQSPTNEANKLNDQTAQIMRAENYEMAQPAGGRQYDPKTDGQDLAARPEEARAFDTTQPNARQAFAEEYTLELARHKGTKHAGARHSEGRKLYWWEGGGLHWYAPDHADWGI